MKKYKIFACIYFLFHVIGWNLVLNWIWYAIETVRVDWIMQIVDSASLPHFCKREGCGSSRHSTSRSDDCFSLDHPFHQQLYNYIKQKGQEYVALLKQGSFHVDVPEPDPEGIKIVETIESEMHKIGDRNGLNHSLSDLKIDSAWSCSIQKLSECNQLSRSCPKVHQIWSLGEPAMLWLL